MRWLAGHVWHTIAFHAVCVPFLYVPKLVWRSPLGVANTVGQIARWVSDAESEPLRRAEARGEDADRYLKLSRQRDRRAVWRGLVLAVTSSVVLGAALYIAFGASSGVRLLALVLAVLRFGAKGAPADAPLVTRAVIKAEVQKLTSDIVVRAMASIGVGPITSAVAKGGDGITFAALITRDGPGWRADIDLPPGGPGSPLVCVVRWAVSGLRAIPRSMRAGSFCGSVTGSKTGFVKWQLAAARRHDIFKGNPFGIGPRGRSQVVPLIQHNVLIGSLPGQGKAASVRVIACGAALDPSVELWLHENKGTGDLDALKCVSHRFVFGIDDESIRYAAESLRLLHQGSDPRGDRGTRAPHLRNAHLLPGGPRHVPAGEGGTADTAGSGAGSPGSDSRGPVYAGHPARRPGRGQEGDRVLAAARRRPHRSRTAAHTPVDHGGARNPEGPHGRAPGPPARLGVRALCPRHRQHAAPPSGGALLCFRGVCLVIGATGRRNRSPPLGSLVQKRTPLH